MTIPGAIDDKHTLLCCVAVTGKLELETGAEQRTHFRSDWHRFNMKRKLNGSPPLEEGAFETLVSNRQDDVCF